MEEQTLKESMEYQKEFQMMYFWELVLKSLSAKDSADPVEKRVDSGNNMYGTHLFYIARSTDNYKLDNAMNLNQLYIC